MSNLMTDTTDTKALREACEILNDHGYLTKSGKIRSSNLAEAVSMIIEQSVDYADQLEAERQRADKAELELIKPLPIGELIQRLEGQTYEKWFSQSDLKGEQGPVAVVDIQHGRSDGNLFALTLTKAGHALKDDVYELFTAPQKPVVLPHGNKPYLVRSQTTAPRAAMTANGDWLHRVQVIEAIEAAGGKVAE